MRLSGLEREVLKHAAAGRVLEEPESAPALAAVYLALDASGLLVAEGWPGDLLPLTVELTDAGRMLMGTRGRRSRSSSSSIKPEPERAKVARSGPSVSQAVIRRR